MNDLRPSLFSLIAHTSRASSHDPKAPASEAPIVNADTSSLAVERRHNERLSDEQLFSILTDRFGPEMTGRFRDMLDVHPTGKPPSLTSSPVVVALPPLPPSPSSPPFDAVSIEGDLSEWEEAVLDELELDGPAQG